MTRLDRRHFLKLAAGSATLGAAVWTARPGRTETTPASANPEQRDSIRLHGMAMHGEPKYKPGFKHFDYVNPTAPKGGTLRLGSQGQTFDTLNPFVVRGVPAELINLTYDTLLSRADDEPFSLYSGVAEAIEVPADRSWIIFHLDPRARYHDGTAMEPEDVLFSLQVLREKGIPFFRAFYANVAKAEKIGPHSVRFGFSPGENRELPLILGDLPVMSRKYWSTKDFSRASLEVPLGSGAYRIERVEGGRSITYARVKDYWAKNLPPNIGYNNFDTIVVDYYRDGAVAREAIKAGAFDVRLENSAKEWATGYDSPAVDQGMLIKREVPHQRVAGMQGFVMNTRKPFFKDRRVRLAMIEVFDFAWSNATLFYGQYTQLRSYFDNSEMSARGLPQAEELEILSRYKGRIPEEVFTTEYRPPLFDGTGNIRSGLRKSFALLKDAGYEVRDFKLVHKDDGRPIELEFLTNDTAFERVVLPYAKNLQRLGIALKVRVVDTAQYINRLRKYDFDMVVASFRQSMSPGNEQRIWWTSRVAEMPGGRNLIGIKDPVVDELVELIIAAPDRTSLVNRVRALDRVLQWGHYVVPNWYIAVDRQAFWDKFGEPAKRGLRGANVLTWWIDPVKEANLRAKRGR
ncbi:MAG: extracellular solute-binding protein [Alphaproteobacteria bacterium]